MATIADALLLVARFELRDDSPTAQEVTAMVDLLAKRLARGDVKTVRSVHLARFVLDSAVQP